MLLIAEALIQAASCIQISASGGSNGESGSASLDFVALESAGISSQIAINGADVTPSTAVIGPTAKFEQTHSVRDASGKSASVYVKVLNAPGGLTYKSRVLPKEGSLTAQIQVSAEQWLTVPRAESIKCTAISSYGTTRSASVGLEERKGTTASDYVTLTGYYGKALTTGTSVSASQTATSGAANSVNVYGYSKDSSGTYRVNCAINGISGGKASFTGLSETASSGTTTQVAQKERLFGTFTSTASYTPVIGTQKSKTRTSNYGTDYYLNMLSAKGSSPAGIVGYYVKPGTVASKIQGAVNAAQSGDTINVQAGTYKENVILDKSLTIKGTSCTSTIVNGNKLGSVFKIGTANSNIDVTLSGLGITGGSGTTSGTGKFGGGVYNKGRVSIRNCLISLNSAPTGGGIYNSGTATITGSTISKNSASGSGGGVFNSGKVSISASTISENVAGYGGGIFSTGAAAIYSSSVNGNTAPYGGGIANGGSLVIGGTSQIVNNRATMGTGGGIYSWSGITFDGQSIAIKYNRAHMPYPLPSGAPWNQQYGVFMYAVPTLKNGFNPAKQVTYNTYL